MLQLCLQLNRFLDFACSLAGHEERLELPSLPTGILIPKKRINHFLYSYPQPNIMEPPNGRP